MKRLKENSRDSDLKYDILHAPHHCSWHTLSYDSLSAKGDKAETSPEAIEALGKANSKAFIISSSFKIEDNEIDPPAYRAKLEYLKILDPVEGSFKCVDDHKKSNENVPLVIEISSSGVKLLPVAGIAKSDNATKSAVNRQGSNGYA